MDVVERDMEKCNLNIENNTLLIKTINQENKENKINIDDIVNRNKWKKIKIKNQDSDESSSVNESDSSEDEEDEEETFFCQANQDWKSYVKNNNKIYIKDISKLNTSRTKLLQLLEIWCNEDE